MSNVFIHDHVSYTTLADLNFGHIKFEGNDTKHGSCHSVQGNGDLFRPNQRYISFTD